MADAASWATRMDLDVMRPTELRAITIAMAILNLTGFLMKDAAILDPTVSLVFVIVVMAASYVVLWYFWIGRNWARWLVLLTSVLALLNLLEMPDVNATLQAVLLVEAALGAYLLYWLNTSAVRAFFRRSRAADGA